jgi:hypothetical protein
MPKNHASKQQLIVAAIELWEEIEPEVLQNLITSMPRRL